MTRPLLTLVECKFCGGRSTIKYGRARGKQCYRCKECGHKFVANDNFVRMNTASRVIAAALDLYFEGLSVWKVRKQVAKVFGVGISHMTVWRWVMKYSALVAELSKILEPRLSGIWHVDETMVNVGGSLKWFWDVIDERTRFIVATHLSGDRSVDQVKVLFRRSLEAAKARPLKVMTDGLRSYEEGFRKVFYSRRKENRVEYVRSPGIRGRSHNNLIERFHGTIKDRTKPMRGFKADYSCKAILDGFVAHYNFVRGHLGLDCRTPAEAAGLDLPVDGGWGDLVKLATWNQTAKEG